MDLVSILRTLGGLGTVLGILSGALWLVRRYDIQLPGRTGMLRVSRLELVERLPLDARRSVALLRRDGREHLILIAPEGHLILESGVVRDAVDVAAVAAASDAVPREIPQFRAELAAAGESFGTLVDHARDRAVPFGRALGDVLGRAAAFAATVRARVRDRQIAPRTTLPGLSTRALVEQVRARVVPLRRALRSLSVRRERFNAVWPQTRSGAVETLRAAAKRTRTSAKAGALHLRAVVANARRQLAQEHRQVSSQVETTLRRLLASDLAFAMPASPVFHDPPIPPRSSLKRKPNRKAVRRAQAARKGLRHA